MSRRLWIPMAAVVALAFVGGAVHFFSGLRTAPAAPTLSSASPSPSSSATSAAGSGRA